MTIRWQTYVIVRVIFVQQEPYCGLYFRSCVTTYVAVWYISSGKSERLIGKCIVVLEVIRGMNTSMFAANHVTNVPIISVHFLVSPSFRGKHFTSSVFGTNKQPSVYAPKFAYFVCDGGGDDDDNDGDDDDDADDGATDDGNGDTMIEVVVHVVVGMMMMIYYNTYYIIVHCRWSNSITWNHFGYNRVTGATDAMMLIKFIDIFSRYFSLISVIKYWNQHW